MVYCCTNSAEGESLISADTPVASVIIPMWNGADLIDECLSHLLANRLPNGAQFEVLVVDNGSTDGSAHLVEQRFPSIHLLRNGRNLGFAGGCNVGIAAARSNHLVLLNQDTAVAAQWLAELLVALRDPAVGIAGGLAFFGDGAYLQHAGIDIELPLAVARHRGYRESLAEEWLQPADVPAVTGAGLAIKREVLDQCGGLDEAFWPGYYEDLDLCYRVRQAGFRVHYAPTARLIHQESSSFQGASLLAAWARLRGRLRFVLKHLSPAQILTEFLPAEAMYRAIALDTDEDSFIARAYLEAIPMTLALHTDQPSDWLREVAEGFATLYGRPELQWPLSGDQCPVTAEGVGVHWSLPTGPWSLIFRIPLFGQLMKGLRRSLHQLILFYVQRQETASAAQVRRQAVRIRQLERALASYRNRSGSWRAVHDE